MTCFLLPFRSLAVCFLYFQCSWNFIIMYLGVSIFFPLCCKLEVPFQSGDSCSSSLGNILILFCWWTSAPLSFHRSFFAVLFFLHARLLGRVSELFSLFFPMFCLFVFLTYFLKLFLSFIFHFFTKFFTSIFTFLIFKKYFLFCQVFFFFNNILFLSHGCNVFSYLANVINASLGKFFSPCIISVSSKLLLFCTLIYLVEAFLKNIFIRGCQNSWSSLTVSLIVECHAVPVDGGSLVSVSSDSSTWAC